MANPSTYKIHWVIDLLSKCIPFFWLTLHQQEREISHAGIKLIACRPKDEMWKSKRRGPTEANLKRITKSLEFLKILISNTFFFFLIFFKASKSQNYRPGSQHAGSYVKQKHSPQALQFRCKTKIKQSKITLGVYEKTAWWAVMLVYKETNCLWSLEGKRELKEKYQGG